MPDIALDYEAQGVLPRVAYDNFIGSSRQVTLVGSSEDATDGPDDAAASWSLSSRWRTTAGSGTHTLDLQLSDATVAATAWGLAGHNLGDVGATVHLERYDGGGWVQVGEAYMPADASVIYDVFDAVADDRWRLVFSGASDDIEVGLAFIGPDLELQRGARPGWTDPRLGQRAETVQEVSRSQVWLGSTVLSRYADLSLSLRNLRQAWARDHWMPFRQRCEAQPFLLHWHRVDWPTSAAYCSAAEFGNPSFGSVGFVDAQVSFRGEVEP